VVLEQLQYPMVLLCNDKNNCSWAEKLFFVVNPRIFVGKVLVLSVFSSCNGVGRRQNIANKRKKN